MLIYRAHPHFALLLYTTPTAAGGIRTKPIPDVAEFTNPPTISKDIQVDR